MRPYTILAVTFALAGCAGAIKYSMPETQQRREPWSKVIERSRDEVWATSVPALSKRFFVINNLDKSSGLINLSYAGDPERFVDCGRVTSEVKNLAGARGYDFAGSSASQRYETMSMRFGLTRFARKMELEGRVNVVFEAIDAGRTRVTANVRYVLTRKLTATNAAGQYLGNMNDSITFNSGQVEAFPVSTDDGTAVTCLPTGELEKALLSDIS